MLQALTADGQMKWKSLLPAVTDNSVPDGSGGLIVTEHATCNQGQTDPMTIVDIDATTGQPLWQFSAAGIQFGQTLVYCYSPAVAPAMAIRPDGWIVMSEPTNAGLPALMQVYQGAMYSISIPDSSFTDSSGVVHAVQSMTGLQLSMPTARRMSSIRSAT
jgi:outer membrane protein assembly factor BamB